jgi:hypothetical protein
MELISRGRFLVIVPFRRAIALGGLALNFRDCCHWETATLQFMRYSAA